MKKRVIILKELGILQEYDEGKWIKRPKARINPWNPLSYIALIVIAICYLVAHGANGIQDIKEWKPFKWS